MGGVAMVDENFLFAPESRSAGVSALLFDV